MPDVEPISTAFLHGLVMVLRAILAALTIRIYKMVTNNLRAASGFMPFQWLCCSTFAPNSCISPQNRLYIRAFYQFSDMIIVNEAKSMDLSIEARESQ
jgi:hypothetical protein